MKEKNEKNERMKKILSKSEEWKAAIAAECVNSVGSSSVFKSLSSIFDDESGEEVDEEFRRRIVKKYNLHVAIERSDVAHLSETMREAKNLCEEIFRKLPSDWGKDFDQKVLKKNQYGFVSRGEQVVFRTFRNCNATIIEVTVRTEDEDIQELVYWTKNGCFIMKFVLDFNDELSITSAGDYHAL